MPLTKVRPERRRRGDVIAAALLALVLVGGATVLWRTSAAAGTVSSPAAAPVVAPAAAGVVPAAVEEVWRAPSAATPAPVVAGPAVVTADGSTVVGRDAVTGAEAWSYRRDRPLCTVGAGFPNSDGGTGRALAVYAGTTGYCSELTALHPDTGVRAGARNPDVRPGTRLVADSTYVVLTGTDYLEVLRSDLVKTVEYGAVTTPVQLDRQPRTGCTYGSAAIGPVGVGVVERCPGEGTDRLTVLVPGDTEDTEEPDEVFSVLLPASGATLVAIATDRVAVALPGPPRLLLLDRAGVQVATVPLEVPDADLAADPPGGVAAVTTGADQVHWWTGSRSVALDATGLAPLWTVDGALGPALPHGGGLLVPVPDGLREVDPVTGAALRTLPVSRGGATTPVRLAAHGEILLEQRGSEIVALAPAR